MTNHQPTNSPSDKLMLELARKMFIPTGVMIGTGATVAGVALGKPRWLRVREGDTTGRALLALAGVAYAGLGTLLGLVSAEGILKLEGNHPGYKRAVESASD